MAVPTFKAPGAHVGGSSAANAVLPLPGGANDPVANDIVLTPVYIEADKTATFAVGTGYAQPAGTPAIYNPPVADTPDNLDQWLHVPWHRAAGAESGNVTHTWTGAAWREGKVGAVVSGCKTTGDPWHAIDTAVSPNNSPSATTPIVRIVDCPVDTLLVAFVSDWRGIDTLNVGATGFTVQGATADKALGIATKALPAGGDTGDIAFTVGASRAGSWAVVLFALIPDAAGGTTFPVSVAGTTTPTGALAKQAAKTPAGTTTPTGLLLKLTGKRPSGATTPTGVLTKAAAKLLAATTTPTGILSYQLNRALAGQSTPTGILANQATKTLTGNTTPTGTIATTLVRLIAFAGSSTPVGTLIKRVGKTIAGTTTPTAAVAKRPGRTLAGSTAPVGAVLKLLSRLLGGSTTPSGSVTTLIPGATVTPASRTHTVPAETRSHTIPAEDRTYVVPAESRTLEVR